VEAIGAAAVLAAVPEAAAGSEASAAGMPVVAEPAAIGEENSLERILSELVERLKSALGDQLVSVILYGSAAVGDWDKENSDLNVLCALNRISPRELLQSEPVVAWWRQQGRPPLLLLTAEEVRTSTDCFAIEFHDMKKYRRVLYGVDLIEDLTVENTFYRAQVEHELRAKQIRLRQKAAELLSKPDRVIQLLIDSISTFCVLGRHALLLSGSEPRWKKAEVVAGLEAALGRPLSAFNEILAVRESGKQPSGMAATPLLERYLVETDALVRFVDALAK
jgi:predicted nucleotidyltransferase